MIIVQAILIILVFDSLKIERTSVNKIQWDNRCFLYYLLYKNNNNSCKHNNLFINNNVVKDTKNPRDLNQKTEKKIMKTIQ